MQALCGKAAALTLRAPAAKAAPPAARLSARRCGAFSAGSLALQRSPQPQRAVVVSRVVEANRGNQGGKLKTRKSAAKRYKVTASGKLVRRHAMKGHLLAKKSPSRKNRLGKEALVCKFDKNNCKDCLPYANIA